jgi:hypothetical protein
LDGASASNANDRYTLSIEDDYSYPQIGDIDYGLTAADINFSPERASVGVPVTITVSVHNHGLCEVRGAWGWYSPTGRSCWAEWDFEYPASDTVDISYRCRDKDAPVHWRVEVDGVELASPWVPSTEGGDHWKIVTIHDVPIAAGNHTVFLGTYQMDFYPDYEVDWVRIGDTRIEAERYDRMGGNDPNPDLRGLTIVPRCAMAVLPSLTVQIWDGDPSAGGTLLSENCVGPTNTIIDRGHDLPGHTLEAHYIPNGGVGSAEYEWVPTEAGSRDIYVVVDPDDVSPEIDEMNNIASKRIRILRREKEAYEGLSFGHGHPNPFRRGTEIQYALSRDGHVKLAIFNVQGQRVRTLVDAMQTAGPQSVRWDAGLLPNGVYFVRLQAGGKTETRRMILLR